MPLTDRQHDNTEDLGLAFAEQRHARREDVPDPVPAETQHRERNPASEFMRLGNKLAKWRLVFAGWQLGTRPREDGESRAVKDHREVTMLIRAEVNAFTSILLKKGICTAEEWTAQLCEEYAYLDSLYEKKFPGFKTRDDGLDIDGPVAQRTMRELNFPQ